MLKEVSSHSQTPMINAVRLSTFYRLTDHAVSSNPPLLAVPIHDTPELRPRLFSIVHPYLYPTFKEGLWRHAYDPLELNDLRGDAGVKVTNKTRTSIKI
jgi:hypothetical protein